MIVSKIVSGFVVQLFDTETKEFVSQEFIAGDQCDYEVEYGEPITDIDEIMPYLSYEMIQPESLGDK